jgi:hypothetical protein
MYSSHEYELVMNRGELKFFDEVMSYEKKTEWLIAM